MFVVYLNGDKVYVELLIMMYMCMMVNGILVELELYW